MKNKNNRVRWFIYFAFFMLFLYLGWKVPYCHDEWKWGLHERLELMKNGFDNYNGRWIGNILIIVITRVKILKPILIAVSMIAIVWLMETDVRRKHIFEKDRCDPLPLLAIIFLLLAVPASLYGQSYGWPAAFVNYEVSVPFFLIYFIWTNELYRNKVEKYSWFQSLIIIPVGICTQLFSENITIITVAYAIWMIVYTVIKYRKVYLLEINYLCSVIAGAIIMFSNSSYWNAASHNGKNYKTIDTGVRAILKRFVTQMWPDLMLNNWVLIVAITALMVALIIKSGKRNFITIEMFLVFVGYSVFSVFYRVCADLTFDGNEVINGIIITILSILFLLNVLVCVWMFVDKEEKVEICITYMGAFAFAAPLVAADPIGVRCFYVSYVFQALVIAKLLQYFLKDKEVDLFYPVLVLAVVTCIIGIMYIRIFMIIGKYDDYRAELIKKAKEEDAKELVLPIIPFDEYTGFTEPIGDIWLVKFKEFYHIPEDVTVTYE